MREATIIKGINGGKLTLDAINAKTLLSLNKTESDMTNNVWNPQSGVRPMNTPKAMENDFILLLPSLSNTSSWMNFLKLFFLKLLIKFLGMI